MSSSSAITGFSRSEFGRIFQIYSQNVYNGFFRDFSFTLIEGKPYISFKEEAGKTPLITIEKRRLGPDRNLFIATIAGMKGEPVEVVRSEKIDHFVERLKEHVNLLRENASPRKSLRVVL